MERSFTDGFDSIAVPIDPDVRDVFEVLQKNSRLLTEPMGIEDSMILESVGWGRGAEADKRLDRALNILYRLGLAECYYNGKIYLERLSWAGRDAEIVRTKRQSADYADCVRSEQTDPPERDSDDREAGQ